LTEKYFANLLAKFLTEKLQIFGQIIGKIANILIENQSVEMYG